MNTTTYSVTGMTCGGCEATVTSRLQSVRGVEHVAVSHISGTAVIRSAEHIAPAVLQEALGGAAAKYGIKEAASADIPLFTLPVLGQTPPVAPAPPSSESKRTWLQTYTPLLLVFGYITLVTLLIQASRNEWNTMLWMNHFMAGFFLVFSFFKMLDLRAFVSSYAMYDVIARRIPQWGYVYAFMELGLGILFALGVIPVLTNATAFVLMSVSVLGVIQSVVRKQEIRCACLGAVFNLPMSTVTIIEDVLMIAMSGASLLMMM
ncbi:MAG: heavy-metal-associated domain-containing protein [Candidatus Kapabacteria bacterium]|nr:heavy-metal-associated domain-containing protein [Candidatus Kapabacteria bacterium]